jgi:hypothetical protein
MNDQHLEALLAARAGTIQTLLPPHLWPLRPFKVEQFGALTKYTLGEAWPGTWAMLHRLAAPDAGPPHCHPCPLLTHIITGGYAEVEFRNGGRIYRDWVPGSSHFIAADCIHTIPRLLADDCWSLVFAGPVVREWQHYPELA